MTRRRKLGQQGFTYGLQLFSRRDTALYYEFAINPVVFIQDPIATTAVVPIGGGAPYSVTSQPSDGVCVPTTQRDPKLPANDVTSCSTRWTYGGGFSPFGLRFKMLPSRRIHPTIGGSGALVFTTRDEPVNDSMSLNYMGELGVGFEVRSHGNDSWSVEYRAYHLSNGYTGDNNPGIDGQMIRAQYYIGSKN